MATVFGAATLVLFNAIAFGYAAVCSWRAWAFTWSGVFGTAAPAGLTTTVAFMPGCSVQNSRYVPAFGNAYVAVAGGDFGPCGPMAPLETGIRPEIVFGPNGPNASGL